MARVAPHALAMLLPIEIDAGSLLTVEFDAGLRSSHDLGDMAWWPLPPSRNSCRYVTIAKHHGPTSCSVVVKVISTETRMTSAQAIPSASISVAPSTIFTYPTRLADSWTPAIQEIHLPGYEVTRPEIEIAIRAGSTRSLRIRRANSLKGHLKALYKRFVPQIQMHNDYIYDSRYEIDDNIAHVLDSVVSAVLAARKTYPDITVILRAKASAMARDVFKLLGIPIICTNAEVTGSLILLKQPGRDRFYGDGLYGSLFNDVEFEGYERTTAERIFISRKNTRRLLNEVEVEELLKQYGYQKVYFEDIPICKQWSMIRNAKAIVGIHGAALSTLLFSRNNVKMIELFHPGFLINWCRHMTNAVGGKWCGVTGQLPPDIIKHLDYNGKAKHFAFHDTRIDITSLRMALKNVGIG
jgi:hypothetical protein